MGDRNVILLIDAGNSRVKFGWLDTRARRRAADMLALGHAELDRLPSWLARLPQRPQHALGVNVASADLGAQIAQEVARHCGAGLQWVTSRAEAAGIVNLYEQPTQLGNDRWVALVGLSTHAAAAAILASFGTATTVDTLSAVDAKGRRRFEGGIILPGPELMRRSLANGTAGLPYAEGDSIMLPRNTHAAISSGIAAAQAGALLRQWRSAVDILGVAPQVYCTGGGWPLVSGEVAAALARAQSDLGLPEVAARWLEAPVLDGLAGMALDQPGLRA